MITIIGIIFSFLINFNFIYAVNDHTIDIGRSNKIFTTKIYQELSAYPEDVLVSPASLQAVLGLLQLGAEGQTALELAESLSFPLDRQQLLYFLFGLRGVFQSRDNSAVDAALASSIYVRDDIQVSESYRNLAASLETPVGNLNRNHVVAEVEVNKWIERATHGQIGKVLSPGDVTTDTALLLVNALYFKGRWSDAFFKSSDTKSGVFYSNGNSYRVNMMHSNGYFNLGRDYELNATFLELPYLDSNFVLTIVLPDDKIHGLGNLIRNVNRILFSPPELEEQQVDLQLPKFQLKATKHLKPFLQNLGIRQAFSDARLDGLTTDGRLLSVSDVIHQTMLDVNEEGTEASAASVIRTVDRIFNPVFPFHANHPFLFVLQHKPSGVVLFIGHFSNPTS